MYAIIKTTCPDCEKTYRDRYNIPAAYNFTRLLEFVSDNIAICPGCGSPRAGISSCTIHCADEEFEIPIYKGPMGGED